MPGIDENLPFHPLNIAVLTVSDTRTMATDTSGALLAERLTAAGHNLAARAIVTDDVEVIRDQMRAWIADRAVDIVVSTGGTGFAPRDQTPEGTRLVIEREAPGLAEAMRLISPLGRLSRGIAGIRGDAIVCNTPGSPKGCVEQLGAILDVLPHALRLLHDRPTAH